jgi:fumarate hydratase subunit beta
MAEPIRLTTPLSDEDVIRLKAGDRVLLSGVVFTGRDAAHKRMFALLRDGKELPVDLRGQVIYYVGPTPAKPGHVIGSAGPTTAGRMDAYAPLLIAHGLKGMIGKGLRDQYVRDAIREHRAVYFAATAGAGALLARTVKSCEIVAYEDLGTEAIRRLVIEDLPVIVINDCNGGDLYREGVKVYERTP